MPFNRQSKAERVEHRRPGCVRDAGARIPLADHQVGPVPLPWRKLLFKGRRKTEHTAVAGVRDKQITITVDNQTARSEQSGVGGYFSVILRRVDQDTRKVILADHDISGIVRTHFARVSIAENPIVECIGNVQVGWVRSVVERYSTAVRQTRRCVQTVEQEKLTAFYDIRSSKVVVGLT